MDFTDAFAASIIINNLGGTGLVLSPRGVNVIPANYTGKPLKMQVLTRKIDIDEIARFC